jgi:hypothetical protein
MQHVTKYLFFYDLCRLSINPVAETDRIVAPVLKQNTGPRQRTMDSYLMKYEDQIKFGQVRSARLRALWQNE